MVVKKEDDTVILINDNKKVGIYFSDNGDLYWDICDMNNNKSKYICFEITKENYSVYQIFEQLYEDIINRNIYQVDEYDIQNCRHYKDLIKLYKNIEDKNHSYDLIKKYNILVNNGLINWISNDNNFNLANVLRIFRVDETIFLEFILMDPSCKRFIKFNNNRNIYKPFNTCFMKHFQELYSCDVNNAQIHIEEWLYQQKNKKKVRK